MMMGQTMVALATGVLVLVTAVGGEAALPPDFWEMVLQSPDVPATGAVKPYAGFPGQPVQCLPHAGCPFPDFERVGPMTPPCRPEVVARLLALTDGQKKALAAVLQAGREQARPLLARHEAAREQFFRDQQILDGNAAELRARAACLAAAETDLLLARALVFRKLMGILTPEQQRLAARLDAPEASPVRDVPHVMPPRQEP